MELRILRYYLTVAREENITRAASLLHVTQPTLSRQLMQLEEELGVKLFHRSQYKIVLTNDGMLLRRRAQEIVDLADKTQREFLSGEHLAGRLVVGSGDLLTMGSLAAVMASFRQSYPMVQYEMYSGDSDNIKERIERGILDLGLLMEPIDISKYQFIRMPVKEQWGVYVCQCSPLAQHQHISPADLAGMSLIYGRRQLVQSQLRNWLGQYADKIEMTAEGNLPYNLAMLSREGIGAFISLKLDCQFDGLRFIPLEPKLESNSVLVWKKAEILSPVTERFIEHAQKCLGGITADSL